MDPAKVLARRHVWRRGGRRRQALPIEATDRVTESEAIEIQPPTFPRGIP